VIVFLKHFIRILRKTHLLGGFIQLFGTGMWIFFKGKNNVKFVGSKYLPPRNRPRMILAGNHSSGADAYLLLALFTGRFFRRFYAVAHERSFRKETVEKIMLEAFDMIPRVGTGQQLVDEMCKRLLANKTIAIPPEGMTSKKVMKGYTGVMRLYWKANKAIKDPKLKIPIIPIVSIGANEAYPVSYGEDGKYHPKKIGIIGRFGKPIHYKLPDNPDKSWFREKTDELMDHIAKLTLQKEGVIESWKQQSLKRKKPREYSI
jgi:1-acyl-sn-glycerol-3-phosphate acyltransferase